jgi:hypothetical protein
MLSFFSIARAAKPVEQALAGAPGGKKIATNCAANTQ